MATLQCSLTRTGWISLVLVAGLLALCIVVSATNGLSLVFWTAGFTSLFLAWGATDRHAEKMLVAVGGTLILVGILTW